MTPGFRAGHRLSAAVLATTLATGALAGCGEEPRSARSKSATSSAAPSATATPSLKPLTTTPEPVPPPPASTPAKPPSSPPATPKSPQKAAKPKPPAKPKVPVITRIATKDKVVFITIDDGWEKDPRFLQMVHDRQVPLTVFLTNDAIRRNYGYFAQLKQMGTPIENHTMTHPLLTRLNAARQRKEICPVQGIYKTTYGAQPTLFRPPYGAYNTTTREVAAACGLKALINWTAEYKSETRRMYYQGPGGLHPGDIILWHFNPEMPVNFAKLLRIIRKQGLTPAPLTKYLPAA